VLIGGDWNTTTYNSKRALYSIAGFFRRMTMGVEYFVKTHYLHPYLWFERKLFKELERRGYVYLDLNEPGVGTLPYDVSNLAVKQNMGDWIPGWCFWFIRWALRDIEGRCSLKLDWFTGKGIKADSVHRPRVIINLQDAEGPLSDHDAIVLDFVLSK
jgi:hypothetical protein